MTFFLQASFWFILRVELYFSQINFESFTTFYGGVLESSLKFYFSLTRNEQFFTRVNAKVIPFSFKASSLIIITVAYVFLFFIFSKSTVLHFLCGYTFTFKPSLDTFIRRLKRKPFLVVVSCWFYDICYKEILLFFTILSLHFYLSINKIIKISF